MSPDSHRVPARLVIAGKWAAWAVAGMVVFGMLVPIAPLLVPLTDVESSWRAVLQWQWLRGAVFGRDVVWTYGPWGFAAGDQQLPETWGAAVFAQGVVVAALVVGWGTVWRRARVGAGWSVFGAGAAVVAGAFVRRNLGIDPIYFLLPLLTVGVWSTTPPGRREVVGWAMIVAIGLASLMKFTEMPLACLTVAACAALRGWRGAAVVGTYAASVGAWWLAAGQPLGAFPAWLGWSMDILGGYGEGEALSSGRSATILLYAAGAALLISAHATLIAKAATERRSAAAVGVVVLATLFMLLKASFVRDDFAHNMVSGSSVVVLALATVPLAMRVGLRAWRAGALVCLGLAVVVGVVSGERAFAEGGITRRGWHRTWTDMGIGVERWAEVWRMSREPEGLRAAYEQRYGAMRATVLRNSPPPALVGTADIYGTTQRQLILAGVDLRPRPIPHSYNVYSPAQAELNARHLTGADAPANLVLSDDTPHEHYATLYDSLSWREMLSRYAPAEGGGNGVLVLGRRGDGAGGWRLEALGTPRRCGWGEWIDVPSGDGGLVWAEVGMGKTLGGKLRSAVWKPALTRVEVETREGERQEHGFVPALGASGFLVSPEVARVADVRGLFASPAVGRAVTRVRFAREGSGWRDDFEVRFYRLLRTSDR